jgi:hypothetical protein
MVGGGTAGPKVTGGTGGQGERREVERCRLCVAKKIQSNGRSKRGGGGGVEKGNRTILVFGVRSSVTWPNRRMNVCDYLQP